jgi:RNA polymerase sigma-70 factor, ECF subfamily
MRRSLVDRARRRLAAKRGGGAELLDVDALGIPFPDDYNKDHVRMNDALERLAAMDPRKAELV